MGKHNMTPVRLDEIVAEMRGAGCGCSLDELNAAFLLLADIREAERALRKAEGENAAADKRARMLAGFVVATDEDDAHAALAEAVQKQVTTADRAREARAALRALGVDP